jgi:hypothetical protein
MTAAASTIEALAFCLRERGTGALIEPKVQARLAALDDDQVIAIAGRLQRLKPEIARAWKDDDVAALFRAWKGAR